MGFEDFTFDPDYPCPGLPYGLQIPAEPGVILFRDADATVVIQIPDGTGEIEICSDCGWWRGTITITEHDGIRYAEQVRLFSPKFDE